MTTSATFFSQLAGYTSRRSQSMARQRANWTIRGDRYLRRYGGMKPDALVQVDPDLQMHVLGLIEQIAPVLGRAYDVHLGKLAQDAFRLWPVRSGLSKSLLSLEYTTSHGGIRFIGRVRNRAPYAYFIRYSGSGRYGEVARDLVFDPGETAAIRILRDAGEGVG